MSKNGTKEVVETPQPPKKYRLKQYWQQQPKCISMINGFDFPINLKGDGDDSFEIKIKGSTTPPKRVAAVCASKVRTPNGKPLLAYLMEDDSGDWNHMIEEDIE